MYTGVQEPCFYPIYSSPIAVLLVFLTLIHLLCGVKQQSHTPDRLVSATGPTRAS